MIGYLNDVHGEVIAGGLGGDLTTEETTPCFVALMDDLGGILLVLGFARESELVLGLAIGDLVDPEGERSGDNETRKI